MVNREHVPFPLLVKPCSDKAAFEARPKKNIDIDLDKAKQVFKTSHQYQTVIETPHIIIVRAGEAEITVSRDGRMLIKRISDQNEAAQVADQVFRSIRAAVKPR